MSHHLSDALIEHFALGNLDEAEAVAAAAHIDRCAHCATRAAGAEPLAGAFAEVEDPALPAGLVDEILARAAELPAEGERLPRLRPELWAAGSLLAAAAVLLALTGGLTPWVAEIGTSVRAALVGGGALIASSPVSAGAVAIGATVALVLGGVLVVLRGRDRRR